MLPETFTPRFLRQLELFKIHARRTFLGTRQGGHVSPKKGHGIEFSDYRMYQLGDNPRHIDWGVYARSDRLYVKRFQEEQELSVMLLLDTSRSMMTPPAEGKWEYVRDLALSISYIALMEQDSVAIALPGSESSPFVHGGRAIHRLGALLAERPTAQSTNFVRDVQLSLARVRFPGVGIFISDLLFSLDELGAIANSMLARNLDCTVLQVLGPSDLEPWKSAGSGLAADSESGEEIELGFDAGTEAEYTFLLHRHIQEVRHFLHQKRIAFVQIGSNEPLATAMTKHLPRMGLLK